MKTIICGAGDVGYSIADKLSRENFEVTVIDDCLLYTSPSPRD